MATNAAFKTPSIKNEPNIHYAKNSVERRELTAAINKLKGKAPLQAKAFVSGKYVSNASPSTLQFNPSSHSHVIAECADASSADVSKAIKAALDAKDAWETTPFVDRAAIFLKAADLISGKYRYDLMAATILGQGKNAWQAEIDAAAELCDFLRFNVSYAEQLYAEQPTHNAPNVWNRVEYRALEGFVYAITPFNFTAIAGNLPTAPALLGNVVLWKPSPAAIASNWMLYNILLEAGLPENVIQFVPGDAEMVTSVVLNHPKFASLHFTGSTTVFRTLYETISRAVASGIYDSYPRIVGETGGKNFHLLHRSAAIGNAVVNTVRGAFEYQGQKCSACSRAYVPSSVWAQFREQLIASVKSLSIGISEDFAHFIGPVIHRAAFERLKTVINEAKSDTELELLVGGAYDDSEGFFIHPTVYRTTNEKHALLSKELFGPILVVYVYDDEHNPNAAFERICQLIDTTTKYALTGAVFAQDRNACRSASELLRHSAGNFYINVKCTGAVVGQQPFGGARASGTNDKAGSSNLLSRFVSMRAIKEQFLEDSTVVYPSNDV